MKFQIRKYKKEDEKAVLDICADTGYYGNPIDPIYSDKKVFTDFLRGYYLKNEPEHAFVAEVDGKVIGYLAGSTNQNVTLHIIIHGIFPMLKSLFKQFTGQYTKFPQNKRFLKWVFFKALKQTPNHPKNSVHAHFNLKKGYRNSGIGTALIKTALLELRDKIKKKKLDTVYGIVFTSKKKTVEYFRKAGFDIYDARKTDIFGTQDTYALCITRSVKSLLSRG